MNKNKLLWILFLLININNCIVYCNKEISREDYHFSHDKMINNQKKNDDKSNLETKVSDNQTEVSDNQTEVSDNQTETSDNQTETSDDQTEVSDNQTKASDDDNNNNQNEEKDKKNKDQILNDQNINQEVIVEDADKKPELNTDINSLPLVPEKNNSNDNKQKKKNYILYIIPSPIIFYLIYRFIIKDRDKIFIKASSIEDDSWVQLFNGSDIISKDLIHTITIKNDINQERKEWVKDDIKTRYNNNVRIKKAIGEYWAEDNITIPLLTKKCFKELLNFYKNKNNLSNPKNFWYKNIYIYKLAQFTLCIRYYINECCCIRYDIDNNNISFFCSLNVYEKQKSHKKKYLFYNLLYEIKQTTTNQDLQKNFQLARELYELIFKEY